MSTCPLPFPNGFAIRIFLVPQAPSEAGCGVADGTAAGPWCDEVFVSFSCSIRVSTWNRLNSLKNGVLKSALKTAMSHDPISPVLSDPHLDALDQRLLSILATVKQCTDQFGPDVVLVEDRMTLSHL